MRLISPVPRAEPAQAGAAERAVAVVGDDPGRARAGEGLRRGEDVLALADGRAEPLGDVGHVLLPQRPRGGGVGGLVAQLASPRGARTARITRSSWRCGAQRSASSRSSSTSACGRERAAVLGEQRRGSRASPNCTPSRRASHSPSVAATSTSPAASSHDALLVAGVVLDAEREPGRAELGRAAAGAQQLRRRMAGVAPAQLVAVEDREEDRARTRSSGSRPRRIALVCASTSAGRGQSNVRASTKKRTIEAVAATSSPLPLTSPTTSPSPPPGSVQMPKMSPPLACWPAGS